MGTVLFTQAVLTLGARIEDPTTFVRRLNSLLTALTGTEAAGAAADTTAMASAAEETPEHGEDT